MIESARSPSPGTLEPRHLACIWEAIVFQRSRTELQVVKLSAAQEKMCLELFKEHLKVAPDIECREEMVGQLEQGHFRITESPQVAVSRSIDIALEGVMLISDLDFHVLRNQTYYPFIFSDSPVVFQNTYYQNVTHRGVLGYQTPGLQIFYPLNSETMLLLLDDQVYGGQRLESFVVDITRRSDVSQLNALQLHHSLDAVYFANRDSQEYIAKLWAAHKCSVIPPRNRFVKRTNWLVDNKPADTIYQNFEPQLNIKLDLSFIDCTPIHESEYRFRRRSPDLVEEYRKRCREGDG